MKYIKSFFYTNHGALNEESADGGGVCENGVLRSVGASIVPGVRYKITVEPVGADSKNPPEWWTYESSWARKQDVLRAKKTIRWKSTKENELAIKHAKDVLEENKRNIASFKYAMNFYGEMLHKNAIF